MLPKATQLACRLLAATLAAGALAAAGCSKPRHGIELADYVDFQRHQVDTDVISIPDGRGLEQVGYGWLLSGEEGSPGRALEPDRRQARLDFYSLHGDASGVIFECAVAAGAPKPLLAVRLNGERLGERRLESGRQEVRFDFPPKRVRDGFNRIEVSVRPKAARAGDGRPARLKIRRVLLPTRSGRPLRLDGPAELSAVEVRGFFGRRRALEMPVPSRFELVLELPPAARLTGELALTFRGEIPPPSGPEAPPLRFRVEVADLSGARTVFDLEPGGSLEQDLDVDLSAWAGRQVTLTVEATGRVNGLARLTGARIEGAGPQAEAQAEPPAPPLATLAAASPGGRLGRPDVVLILLDAARADAFSAYGSPNPTPAVDRLAREGTLFLRARSPSSWTGQTVPALFTGMYPDSIGIEHWGSRLPTSVPTLAELAAAAGYRTVLWSQHPFYNARPDLRRGFLEVHTRESRDSLPPAELLTAGAAPLFAVIHLMPPHTPYDPPQPFRGRLVGTGEPPMDVSGAFLHRFTQRESPSGLSPDQVAYARGRYLENVLFADSLVGRILDMLAGAGRYDEALVAVTSDHGEAFLEHGAFLHTRYLWGEYVNVPWAIKWPASAGLVGSTVADPVSLIDLAPTLADGLELPAGADREPAPGFQGRSLLPVIFDGEPLERPVYAYTRGIARGSRPPRSRAMLETREWKIVTDLMTGESRLYDLAADPAEERDLAGERPLQTRWLERALRAQRALDLRLRASLGAGAQEEKLDPETVDKLRALGYLQ